MGIIEVENLTKRYGDLTAVDHISFSVEAGSMLGFLGINSCSSHQIFYKLNLSDVFQINEDDLPIGTNHPQFLLVHLCGNCAMLSTQSPNGSKNENQYNNNEGISACFPRRSSGIILIRSIIHCRTSFPTPGHKLSTGADCII